MAGRWAESGGRRARWSRRHSKSMPPSTLVVVLPHIRDLDSLCDDLSLFTESPFQQFPAWETDAGERVLNDEIYGQRIRVLKSFSSGKHLPRIVVTAIQSLMQPVPSADTLAAATRQIAVGDTLDTAELTALVGRRRMRRVHPPSKWQVSFRCEAASWTCFLPMRNTRFAWNCLVTKSSRLRTFDVATQRSLGITRIGSDHRAATRELQSYSLYGLSARRELVPVGRAERVARRRPLLSSEARTPRADFFSTSR